jgi:hypothetical protein
MEKNILQKQQFMGRLYGMAAGSTFTAITWGVDAFLLVAAKCE